MIVVIFKACVDVPVVTRFRLSTALESRTIDLILAAAYINCGR